tara:strand:- start:95 stop:526 length:432 start_codon:yes stop_codon:yes gene_type:complete
MSEARILEYIKFFEELSLDNLSAMNLIIHDDIHFRDPFNDTIGIVAYTLILEDMFKKVPDIKFVVKSYSLNHKVAFLKWESIANSTKLGKPWIIEGMSEIQFSSDNKVIEHIDYWDSSRHFYEHLPILGRVLKFIRRLVSAKK